MNYKSNLGIAAFAAGKEYEWAREWKISIFEFCSHPISVMSLSKAPGSVIIANEWWGLLHALGLLFPRPIHRVFRQRLDSWTIKPSIPTLGWFNRTFQRIHKWRCLRKHSLHNGRSFLLFCWHSAKFYKELKLQWLLKKRKWIS